MKAIFRRVNTLASQALREAIRLIRHPTSWPGEYFAVPPILVVSFNRPHYLRPMLKSLRDQRPSIEQRRIHLLQDGPVNAYSDKRYADDAEITACIDVFREIFPGGQVHASNANIGICENFIRAEKLAFETLRAPVAYFFEDDLVLSPHYVAALDRLRRALCGRRVGYFNACGSFASSLEEQSARRSELMDMGHLWGFGLKRSHWLAMQPALEPYYRLVVGQDYRHRPHEAIQAYFRTLGISHPATSQDGAKAIATHYVKSWQASTFPCFARYIGKEGTHFNEATFKRCGFDRTTVYPDELGHVQVSRYLIRQGRKNRGAVFKRNCRNQDSSLQNQAMAAQPVDAAQ